MNWATLRHMFYTIMDDSESAPQFVSHARAMSYANQAVMRASAVSRGVESRTYVVLTAGVRTYELPTDLDQIIRVAYDGQRIVPVTQMQLRAQDEAFHTRTGTPVAYYLDEMDRAIGLYPAPSTDTVSTAFDGEYGVPVASTTDGAADVFDGEYGVLVDTSDATLFDGEYGVPVRELSGSALELHYTVLPPEFDSAVDEIPVPVWAIGFVLCEMLALACEADTQIQDHESARLWRGIAESILARMRFRSGSRGRMQLEAPRLARRRMPVQYPAHVEEP